MSKLLQYLVNKPSVKHKVLPGLKKMQMAGQYNAERDATSVNTPVLSKMFGVQREVDVNRFSEDAFKQKYKMTPHQYKMRTDSDYAQAFQRQMDERRQNDPNYSELNLPATDVRSKNYKGNPNLALIPKGATGPARAQQEQLFADMTSLSAPLLPVKSLVRGLQVGKAASAAPKVIDKLIGTPSSLRTAATESADNSGLIINDEVYSQWRNARQSANAPSSTPSRSTSMEAWGTPNWNAAVREPAQNIEPYRAAWEGIERRGPEWITTAVRDWPTSNMSFVDDTRSILNNVTRRIDKKLGQLFSKETNAPAFDADEVARLINENLSKGVGVKKENLPLQVKLVPTGYSPNDLRIETLIDNNKVGSIFLQRNMNPYKPKTFSELFLNKAQTPFERWQSTPGFRKKGDYPFQDYDVFNPAKDPTGKIFSTANDLYSTGISGEFNKAINEVLKAKGLGNVLSGGTGHSMLGEARWKKLVEKGLAEDLGAGYYKLKKEGGPVILPKMQMRGEVNLPGSQTISVNDPRYPEMYKNRQVGAYYDGAFTLPDLDEVVVRGKDERIKEGMSQAINKFYGHASELMSLPQTETMKFLTGKRQTPSQAWGFDTRNKSWYHPKTVSNFLMDAALDPTNLIGVGVLDDLTKGAVRAAAQNTVSKTLQRGISPFDYSVENILRMPQNLIRTAAGKSKQFSNAVQNNIKSGMAPFILQGLKNREDAWSTYLGLKPEFNSMRVVGYDDATGLTKYEYTNPSVFGTASRRPNPKDRIQDQRMDQALYDSSEGKVYNKRILQSDYGDNFDVVDLNVPGSSTVGNDRLFGVMGGFQKYVSPDGKNLMYRDVWDIQPFSRLTSSQLPRDMVGNAIRRFEVSSLIPGARPFVAEGKLGDIKTKFLPAKPYENIKTRFNTELENLKSIDPEGFVKDPQRIREEARRLLAERIKNERTFLNSVEGQGLRKYVDTNPYTRFGDTTPDLVGFDFDPLIPIPKKVLGNIKKIQDFANQPVTKFNMGGPIVDPNGQWAHPGKRTIVPTPTGRITMQGVPYPVYGQDETGFGQMMYPGGEYKFPGQMVDEIPMMQGGGQQDSTLENIVEVFDPTGISSWDDVYRSANDPSSKWYDTAVEVVGALPLVGKLGKLAKAGIHLKKYKGLEKAAFNMIPKSTSLSNTLQGAALLGRGSDAIQAGVAAPKASFFPSAPPSGVGQFGRYAGMPPFEKKNGGQYGRLVKLFTMQQGGLKKAYNPNLAEKDLGFKVWYKNNTLEGRQGLPYQKPFIDKMSYDYYSFFKNKEYDNPEYNVYNHFPDTYKKPNHPTFSNESIYSTPENPGGFWVGENYNPKGKFIYKSGGQHGGLDRWFAEKWVDVKTGKACGRQEGEKRAGYPACRPSKRVSSETPKTSSEMSSAEKAKFKRTKTSSERIPYNHKK